MALADLTEEEAALLPGPIALFIDIGQAEAAAAAGIVLVGIGIVPVIAALDNDTGSASG